MVGCAHDAPVDGRARGPALAQQQQQPVSAGGDRAADPEAALQLHRPITAVSYLCFFADKAPEELPEWIERFASEHCTARGLFGAI